MFLWVLRRVRELKKEIQTSEKEFKREHKRDIVMKGLKVEFIVVIGNLLTRYLDIKRHSIFFQ